MAKMYSVTKTKKKKLIKAAKQYIKRWVGGSVSVPTNWDIMVITKTKYTYSISGYYKTKYKKELRDCTENKTYYFEYCRRHRKG